VAGLENMRRKSSTACTDQVDFRESDEIYSGELGQKKKIRTRRNTLGQQRGTGWERWCQERYGSEKQNITKGVRVKRNRRGEKTVDRSANRVGC